MALCKSIETKYGVNATYSKITDISISWHNKQCGVNVSSYLDKTSREENKLPLRTIYFDYSEDNFDFDVEGNLTAQLYSKIKQESDFLDATDC